MSADGILMSIKSPWGVKYTGGMIGGESVGGMSKNKGTVARAGTGTGTGTPKVSDTQRMMEKEKEREKEREKEKEKEKEKEHRKVSGGMGGNACGESGNNINNSNDNIKDYYDKDQSIDQQKEKIKYNYKEKDKDKVKESFIPPQNQNIFVSESAKETVAESGPRTRGESVIGSRVGTGTGIGTGTTPGVGPPWGTSPGVSATSAPTSFSNLRSPLKGTKDEILFYEKTKVPRPETKEEEIKISLDENKVEFRAEKEIQNEESKVDETINEGSINEGSDRNNMKIVRGKVEFVDENNQKLKVIKEIDKIKEAEKNYCNSKKI